MELSPINVRGKRSRSGYPKQSYTSARTRQALGKAPSKALGQQANHVEGNRVKTSLIEAKVPLEILCKIFMYSENVNFALASGRIGKFLSDIQTRREVFIHAIAPRWLNDKAGVVNSAVEGDSGPCMGNPEFQSALLEYSWVNIRFIAECLQQFMRKNPKATPYSMFGPIPPNDKISKRLRDEGMKFGSSTEFLELNFRAHFRCFKSMTRKRMWGRSFVLAQPLTDTMLHYNTRVPESLITGPWDDNALKKLFWITHTSSSLRQGHTWEVTRSGFDAALKDLDGNGPWVLDLFQVASIWEDWPEYMFAEAIAAVRKAMKAKSWPVDYAKADESGIPAYYKILACVIEKLELKNPQTQSE